MSRRSLTIAATVALAATLATPAAHADPTWRPTSTPESATYVVLESDDGDYIGQGERWEYTPATAELEVTGPEGGQLLSVDVDGDEWWYGRFEIPVGAALDERLYDGATRYPFNADDVPGLSWSGDGRGCNTLTGWFSVDGFAHDETGALSFLLLRFEQYCGNDTAPLRGEIRYEADAPPPTPLNPRPDPGDRWTPDRSLLPDGTQPVVLLDSQAGDFIGQGYDIVHAGYDVVDVDHGLTAGVGVTIDDQQLGASWSWRGTFVGPDDADRLEVGLYDDLQRHPFHNPVLGGLSWVGNHRGCNELSGWFAVDEVGYTPNGLVRLSMRFAQSCDGDPPLYGLVEFGVERTSPDTEAPEVWLEGPGDVTTATDATFDFAASEPATFTCSLDGAPAAPCTSPTTVTGLSAGQHEFTVVAIDGAGNVSDPAPWSWTVEPPDTAAPSVTLTGPEDRTRSGDATFRFTASEPATFTCSLDGAVATPCTSPTTVTGLGGGAHAFAVVATDVAGNVSDAVTWNWSIKGNGGGGGKGGGKPKR